MEANLSTNWAFDLLVPLSWDMMGEISIFGSTAVSSKLKSRSPWSLTEELVLLRLLQRD